MESLDNSNVGKLLGKQVDYPRYYDKSILVREPRQSNRTYLGFSQHSLPFIGYDVWNAWEISTLTTKGRPVNAIAKIVYPADSVYIVESKSLKLYLNSYNMSQMGGSSDGALTNMRTQIERDLNELLETSVAVSFFPTNYLAGHNQDWLGNLSDEWVCLDDWDNLPGIEFTQYSEDPSLLQVKELKGNGFRGQRLWSSLLKSNCRVTKQSDWGDVFIYMMGQQLIDEASLLKYIVSFRDECHFHEEICECIYTRLQEKFKPVSLMVACLYVRRGGIDINPIRASSLGLIPENLIFDDPFVKGPRQ